MSCHEDLKNVMKNFERKQTVNVNHPLLHDVKSVLSIRK